MLFHSHNSPYIDGPGMADPFHEVQGPKLLLVDALLSHNDSPPCPCLQRQVKGRKRKGGILPFFQDILKVVCTISFHILLSRI